MSQISISVVIATYNRAELLSKQLEALKNQTLDTNNFEIVIIDDGSTDQTADVIKQWKEQLSNLRFYSQVNRGPARARNVGAKNAKGDILAFTDDDCIVDLDWVETIFNIFQNESVSVAQGLTYTQKELRTPLTHQIENLKWNHVIPTCNVAYKKLFFFSLGGFDEGFAYPHNEDTDLAWRTLECINVHFYKNMKVYHPPIEVGFWRQLKRMKMLQSEFRLFYKNTNSYRKWRSYHPWVTIYWEVFFKHQLLNLKYHIGFYKKPKLFIKGLLLSVSTWLYLVFLFPKFYIQRKI